MKLLSSLLSAALGDIYLHFPRGSNNRLNEHSENRANDNRLFDSENNGQGGYNVGDKSDVEAEDMDGQSKAVFFQSGSSPSELTLEWTNQHGCGRRDANDANWVDCSFTIQYMCEPVSGENAFHTLQNGFDTETATYTPPPMDMEGGQAYLDRMEYDKERSADKGVHESWHYYDNCFKRERNRGLFVAETNRNRDRGATRTRQNENGAQYGYECPEERDYYPYWHPSPWIDIAHLTSETAQCPDVFENSGNRAAKNLCIQYYDDMEIKMPSMANNEEACLAASGTWTSFYNYQEIIESVSSEEQCIEKSGELGKVFGEDMIWAFPFISNDMFAPEEKCLILPPKVICEKAQYTRANHLGNANGEKAPSFTWTLPNFYSEETRDCALRIRYNITTNDYPDEFDKRQTATYFDILKLEDDPTVTMFNELTLQLAINDAQVSRVFQDRSHLFQIAPRPSEVAEDRKIVNVGVRGRRGNIVQAYPSVEYDFSPQNLEVSSEDLVHIQWEGSNTNPASAGEGREHTDRNNWVPMVVPGASIPFGTYDPAVETFSFVENEETITLEVNRFPNVQPEELKTLCEGIDSTIPVPTSDEYNDAIQAFNTGAGGNWHGNFFLGISDKKEEGVWNDIHSGKAISYTNWKRNRPNNKDSAEHYALMVSNGQWEDVEEARTITNGICVRPYVPKNYELPEMIEEWVWSSVENVEKSEIDNFYVQMASSGYYGCKEGNCERALNDPDIVKMNAKLNNAPAQFLGNIVRFKSGEHQAMCTRNNNFSNRAQKTDITVL